MTWKELPPDFATETFSDLYRDLSIPDVLAINQYAGNQKTLILIKANARCDAFSYVAQRSVESGGLLLGRTFANDGASSSSFEHVIQISNCVFAEESHGTATALRMESSLWSKAAKLKRSNEFVVGWFHSHPNLGAFFSGTDRRTQASFFADDYKVGWVIDPVRLEEAWFIGMNSYEISSSLVLESELLSEAACSA